MEFALGQIFGFISVIIGIISFQLKNMRNVLISQLLCNGVMVLSYALLDGLSGAGVCIIAIIQSIAIYVFNRKDKKIPMFITIVFVLAYIGCSIITYETIKDILPCVAALMFALSLVQQKSSGYRIYMLINVLVWVGYDLSIMAYTTILGRVVLLISIISAMIRIDIKELKKVSEKEKKK